MPLNILLAEDNLVVRQMMADFLSGEGHLVEEVASGDAAWERLESGKPYDLLLLDLCLPGMDGLELLKRMRAEPCSEYAPVIILSADHSAETKNAVLAAGATAFWSKPLTPSELILRVHAFERSQCVQGDGGILQEKILQELVQALGRNRKLAGIMDTFVESLRDYEQRIYQAVRDGDKKELCNLVHGLKGAAAMFGGSSLVNWCLRQEALARQEAFQPDESTAKALGELIDQTCQALAAFMEREGL